MTYVDLRLDSIVTVKAFEFHCLNIILYLIDSLEGVCENKG